MNKKNAADYLPLVQALAEGKTIQCGDDNCGWSDIKDFEECAFSHPPHNYRIKPEPKEIWFNRYNTGVESGPYESKEKAIEFAFHGRPITQVCYREVIE